MKTKLVLGAVAAAVAMFSQGAFAQAASSPTRAEVKADTKAAEKSGKLTPAGEATGSTTPSKASDKTREERKAATKADRSAGKLAPAGEATGSTTPSKGSEVDRAARKADTKAAVKSGKTQPAGEAAQPSGEKPMK